MYDKFVVFLDTCLVFDGGYVCLLLYRHRGHVLVLSDLVIRDRAYSLRALAGCFLRIGIPLFNPCDEQGGRDVPEVGYVLEEVHVGRRDAEYLDIPVPPTIW